MGNRRYLSIRWSKILESLKVIDTKNEVDNLLLELSTSKLSHPTIVAFVNAYAMNKLLNDDSFYGNLLLSDYLLRDGSGLFILYKKLKKNPGINMNGTDLIPKILAAQNKPRIAIWGTEDTYLKNAANYCKTNFSANIVSTENGFHDDSYYVEHAVALNPEVIVLGMGMPKQEKVAVMLKEQMGTPALIICGGAIVDFLGGKTPRAPLFLRKWGMEWAYRLWLEPKRMFKRYIIGNPVFLLRTIIFKKIG